MTVQVEIYGRNIEVTDRITDYITKKVSKLDRYLPGIEEARMDLAYVKSARSAADRQVAQLTVRGKGFILRSEETGDDIFAAIDTSLERMQRRIERYKGKRYHGRGDGKSAAEVSSSRTITPSRQVGPMTVCCSPRRMARRCSTSFRGMLWRVG